MTYYGRLSGKIMSFLKDITLNVLAEDVESEIVEQFHYLIMFKEKEHIDIETYLCEENDLSNGSWSYRSEYVNVADKKRISFE